MNEDEEDCRIRDRARNKAYLIEEILIHCSLPCGCEERPKMNGQRTLLRYCPKLKTW